MPLEITSEFYEPLVKYMSVIRNKRKRVVYKHVKQEHIS